MALNNEHLLEYVKNHIEVNDEYDVLKSDCDIIEFMLNNCSITIGEKNRYFVSVTTKGIVNSIYHTRALKYEEKILNGEFSEGHKVLAYTGLYDFGHTSAQWDSVISLGIFGLKERICQYAENNTDEEKREFYCNLIRVYNAALRFMKRAADTARLHGKTDMADCLEALTTRSPQSLFEAMQTSVVYYVLQNMFDGSVLRTLGRLDSLFYPFYNKDDAHKIGEMIDDYLIEIDAFEATSNIPFALGGTDINGEVLINELSYMFLEAYRKAHVPNVKMHLLCSKNTPDDIIALAFNAIRDGNNSIVFLSDNKVIEALENLGEYHDDAVNYHVVGCYECGGDGEITCSCNARVNIPKALELTLNSGRDMLTNKLVGLENNTRINSFEALKQEFKRQLIYLCDCAIKTTDYFEANYDKMHSAPILSGTYTSALEKGKDLYSGYGAKYNNSSVNALGLATAVDSLAAIRKVVYEDKLYTLNEFTEILKSNWSGNETLRMLIKNKFPKYGLGDKKTDELAAWITDVLSQTINGRENVKGGKYRLGLFSIDWRWEFGEKTAASADGRLSGETISQNTSAVFGADKEGATAHLISASSINTVNVPNGAIVDIDLHYSAVQGENGINALLTTLKTYFELGGFAVHYNILNTEMLKDAKINPEKYPNLQVRLCGWNVLFSTLSEKEKNEFIERSIR